MTKKFDEAEYVGEVRRRFVLEGNPYLPPEYADRLLAMTKKKRDLYFYGEFPGIADKVMKAHRDAVFTGTGFYRVTEEDLSKGPTK